MIDRLIDHNDGLLAFIYPANSYTIAMGYTSVVVLETMVLVSSGLEAKSAGLGLGLDTYGLGLGFGLDYRSWSWSCF